MGRRHSLCLCIALWFTLTYNIDAKHSYSRFHKNLACFSYSQILNLVIKHTSFLRTTSLRLFVTLTPRGSGFWEKISEKEKTISDIFKLQKRGHGIEIKKLSQQFLCWVFFSNLFACANFLKTYNTLFEIKIRWVPVHRTEPHIPDKIYGAPVYRILVYRGSSVRGSGVRGKFCLVHILGSGVLNFRYRKQAFGWFI